jgi:hypothetical protein
MDWLDNSVRRRREEPVDQVRAVDRLGLGTAGTPELGPDSRQKPPVAAGVGSFLNGLETMRTLDKSR